MLNNSNPAYITRGCLQPGSKQHSRPATGWRLVALLAASLVAAMSWAAPLAAQAPTVNGQFFGDGDVNRYPAEPFATSDRGTELYVTLVDGTLYVALLVSSTVNDNVFGDKDENLYLATADWSGGNVDAKRRMDSEFAEFFLDVGEGETAQSFNWQQGYAGQPDGNHDRTTANYISDETVAGGLGSPPPGMVSASSMMWNLNRYAEQFNNGTLNWTMPGEATNKGGGLTADENAESWKSPWVGADEPGTANEDPNSVIDATEGYPATGQITFSPTFQWEWAMVYEWSVEMTQFGQSPVFVITGSSHHSPAKTGEQDDTLNPPEDLDPLSDLGDLPDSYATLKADNGAQHYIDTGSTLQIGASIDSETDGQPGFGALGDDNSTANDEDGVTIPASASSDGVLTTTVTASNDTGTDALLCGWFDFNESGDFTNSPNTSTSAADPEAGAAADTGERSCVTVPTGTTDGQFSIAWTIPVGSRNNTGPFGFRYRLSTDPAIFDTATLAPTGVYTNGEVEDYQTDEGEITSLPVSISAFEATRTPQGLQVEWETVSETHNAGFHILTPRGNNLQQLNKEMIPAKDAGDPLTPRRYEFFLPDAGGVKELIVTAVDYEDNEEMFGLFEVGKAFGQPAQASPIGWREVREEAAERQMARAATGKGNKGKGKGGKNTESSYYADVRVSQRGLQAVTWQDLADAGLDFSGVPRDSIAVSHKGQPVARDIAAGDSTGKSGGNQSHFGPGDEIRFWGNKPDLPDALYIDHYNYRISVDPELALASEQQNRKAGASPTSHLQWLRRDDDAIYQFGSPTEDPWVAKQLRSDRDNTLETAFDVPGTLVADQPGRVEVTVGGLTSFPETPDHHILVEVNGQEVGEAFFDGREARFLDFEVPPGVLGFGQNSVTVRAPGGTAARFDIIAVDSVSLGFPSELHTDDDRLLVEAGLDSGDGLSVSGFRGQDVVAYAWDGDGLHRLRTQEDRKNDRVGVPAIDGPAVGDNKTLYWLSTADRLHRPDVATIGTRQDLLAETSAGLLVIAHPAFMPISRSETHPLNDYIAQRESEGWNVALFDVSDIQAEYATGMPLPGAVTNFLKDADERMEFGHVLLVGGDSYDYTNNLGLGSISFVPTRYARAKLISHAPSDALLADLDGDGLADKAIGRWPVRSTGDLASIVTKTLEWPAVAARQNAVWVTDSDDPKNPSFRAQAERMINTAKAADWTDEQFSRIFWEDIDTASGQSIAETARGQLFSELEQGRALTGFVGHGSPGMWTFQGLLRPRDLNDLHNEGSPTLIGTLTCYTSYFVSPSNNSVAHAWMNGYRTDADGQHVAGAANGAAAIHGAATLSNYNDNESYARAVLEAQLDGKTLGEAVEAGRAMAARRGLDDLVVNWILLGDPTLQLR